MSTVARSAFRTHVDRRSFAALRRCGALLLLARAVALVERAERHRPALVDAAVEGADDAHVGETLDPGRLGVAPVEDALGEVFDLRTDLIVRLELLALGLLVTDGELEREAVAILVRGIDAQLALGPDDLVEAGRLGAEPDGELRQPLAGEAQDRRHLLLDVGEAVV